MAGSQGCYVPAMSESRARRRGHGEDGIYLDAARNRYMGAVSLGYGPDGKRIRRKVFGKTKQEVRDRLKALHQEMNSGVRSSSNYTIRQMVEDWLRDGQRGAGALSSAARCRGGGQAGPQAERGEVRGSRQSVGSRSPAG